ncbi:MAG: class IV adenylate cyclase [Bryobacteraceae bacterium]
MAKGNHEVEIKLRVESALGALRLLRPNGFKRVRSRVYESNTVYDTADLALRTSRRLLRIRTAGRTNTLTFKGVPVAGRHKSREELELTLSDAAALDAILDRLGYTPQFRYEKYRTEFQRPGEPGIVTLDETPIGVFLELEGPPRWIDRTAKALGFKRQDYVTLSYGSLYLEYCKAQGVTPSEMVFSR